MKNYYYLFILLLLNIIDFGECSFTKFYIKGPGCSIKGDLIEINKCTLNVCNNFYGNGLEITSTNNGGDSFIWKTYKSCDDTPFNSGTFKCLENNKEFKTTIGIIFCANDKYIQPVYINYTSFDLYSTSFDQFFISVRLNQCSNISLIKKNVMVIPASSNYGYMKYILIETYLEDKYCIDKESTRSIITCLPCNAPSQINPINGYFTNFYSGICNTNQKVECLSSSSSSSFSLSFKSYIIKIITILVLIITILLF